MSYSISETRGKKRQNIINDTVVESLKQDPFYDGCIFKTEVRIPGKQLFWGKYFPVDICIYRNDIPIEIVLIKAPASNIKQNNTNSKNSIHGDVSRLSKMNGIKISLINFLPKKTPFFKRDETIKNFENNSPFFLSSSGFPYKFDIDEIFILFELDNLEACEKKSDVKNLFNSNPIKNIGMIQENYTGTGQ